MYFQLGSYQTQNNSSWATWTFTARVSQRGRKVSELHRVTLHTLLGFGSGLTQDGLTTLIHAHEAGVRQENVDLRFFKDDGTDTAHNIINSQTRNGLTFKGIHYPGYFPGMLGAGSEYAEGAAIRYVVSQHEAEVLEVEDNILHYWQGYKYNLGGIDYAVVEALTGAPQQQITKLQSKFWAIQKGFAVGAFTNPNAGDPLFAAPPLPSRSWVDFETPAEQGRQDNIGFRTSWSYYVESPGVLNAVPPENP